MAHVKKLPTGRWQARYRGPDGRERARNFDRKVDAERWLTQTEAAKLRGEWVDPRLASQTFGSWAEEWLTTTVGLKPKTRAGYESLLRIHVLPGLGARSLGSLRQVDVKAWVARLEAGGLSPSRVRQAYRVVSAVMGAAVESGYVARTPCVGVKLPRLPQRDTAFLDAGQVDALAEAVPPAHRTLVYLLAYGGLRWGEAVALRRRRCDLLRGRVDIAESLAEIRGQLHFGPPKTHQRRVVALPAFLRDLLAEQLAGRTADPEALVFVNEDGGPVRHAQFWRRVWQPALRTVGLPHGTGGVRIHDLRHTCVALLIAQGAHAKAIAEHLGHSNIQTTINVYGHLFPDEKDRVAVALDATWRAAQGRGAERVPRIPRTLRGLYAARASY